MAHIRILQDCWEVLAEHTDPRRAACRLYTRGVITDREMEDTLEVERDRSGAVDRLLLILNRKKEDQVVDFLRYLTTAECVWASPELRQAVTAALQRHDQGREVATIRGLRANCDVCFLGLNGLPENESSHGVRMIRQSHDNTAGRSVCRPNFTVSDQVSRYAFTSGISDVGL